MRSKGKIMTKCKVEVFSRVTGFYRPVQDWNKGKVEEFKDRKHYDIKEKKDVHILGTSGRN
jgi:anaerobic ribonucleoside-triphosphate reductase